MSEPELKLNSEMMAAKHGGWERGEHIAQPVTAWQTAVAQGGTRLGYWDWVLAQVTGEPEQIAESVDASDGGTID